MCIRRPKRNCFTTSKNTCGKNKLNLLILMPNQILINLPSTQDMYIFNYWRTTFQLYRLTWIRGLRLKWRIKKFGTKSTLTWWCLTLEVVILEGELFACRKSLEFLPISLNSCLKARMMTFKWPSDSHQLHLLKINSHFSSIMTSSMQSLSRKAVISVRKLSHAHISPVLSEEEYFLSWSVAKNP